jgi:2-C-methyl-D-erythritol 4-phosphate cytidylyltransferase
MSSSTPKQYLNLHGKPLALYSFEVLLQLPELHEIVVVCEPEFTSLFQAPHKKIQFARPGERRQDSVYHGMLAADPSSQVFCIHDAARPFITLEMVRRVIQAGLKYGAATVSMPLKFTIKECCSDHLVTHTPDRAKYREIQTPQVVNKELLQQGFAIADDKKLTVTDDVSLAELTGQKVKLVEGSQDNIKITTPIDLDLALLIAKRYEA